jgi:hypothetical protein
VAEICGFSLLRVSGSSALCIDNGSRKRHALAALGLASERTIRLAGAHRTTARGLAHFPLPNCIADADDHQQPRYCEWF